MNIIVVILQNFTIALHYSKVGGCNLYSVVGYAMVIFLYVILRFLV
jgi:hypothetical protein